MLTAAAVELAPEMMLGVEAVVGTSDVTALNPADNTIFR